MIPSYLPVLKIARHQHRSHSGLLGLLVQHLTGKGIRTAVMAKGYAGRKVAEREKEVIEAAIHNELVIVEDMVCAGQSLVIGSHDDERDEPELGHCFYCPDETAVESCAERIAAWLTDYGEEVPVWGCILIGGKSSRMGRPKQLITSVSGRTWLEEAVSSLRHHVSNIVISGSGQVPRVLNEFERIYDLPGISGPLAGVASVMHRYPLVSWVLLACDMPDVTSESITWLLGQRRMGHVAVIPRNPENGRSEPLFAWYDFRCAPHVAEILASGERRIRYIRHLPRIREPNIPQSLCHAWRNVNRPEERD